MRFIPADSHDRLLGLVVSRIVPILRFVHCGICFKISTVFLVGHRIPAEVEFGDGYLVPWSFIFHTPFFFYTPSILYFLLRTTDAHKARTSYVVGLLLAVGMALRPSFVLIGAGPIIWTFRRDRGVIVRIAVTAIAVSSLWLVPTIYLSGGLERWQLAHSAFIIDGFVDPWNNFERMSKRILLWSLLLIVPAAPLLPRVRQISPRLRGLTLAAALPALAFYIIMFVSEPGYFQGLVPLCIVCTSALIAITDKPFVFGTLALVVQLTILILPEGGSMDIKTPSIPEIVNRRVIGEVILTKINRPLKENQAVLYITDYPGTPLQRQLPKMREHTHVLWLHWATDSRHGIATLSHSTDRKLTPIPGPVMYATGRPRIFDTAAAYHSIVLAPVLSNHVRHHLKSQSRCEIPDATRQGQVVHLLVTCFPQGKISFNGNGISFTPLQVVPLK